MNEHRRTNDLLVVVLFVLCPPLFVIWLLIGVFQSWGARGIAVALAAFLLIGAGLVGVGIYVSEKDNSTGGYESDAAATLTLADEDVATIQCPRGFYTDYDPVPRHYDEASVEPGTYYCEEVAAETLSGEKFTCFGTAEVATNGTSDVDLTRCEQR